MYGVYKSEGKGCPLAQWQGGEVAVGEPTYTGNGVTGVGDTLPHHPYLLHMGEQRKFWKNPVYKL